MGGKWLYSEVLFPGFIQSSNEIQTALARIWTRVAMSSSSDDNHYTSGTSFIINVIYQYLKVFNYVQTIVILMCKKISSDSFKNYDYEQIIHLQIICVTF